VFSTLLKMKKAPTNPSALSVSNRLLYFWLQKATD